MKAWKNILLLGMLWIGWFLLTQWVLPYFGAPSCTSGSCSIVPQPAGSFHQLKIH
jgi:hypothetical protein